METREGGAHGLRDSRMSVYDRRMRSLALVMIALPALAAADGPVFHPPPPAKGYSYPECYCTNRGERVEMGETSCIRIGSQSYTAMCGMSLNNPTWRKVKDGCDPVPGLSLAPLGFEATEPG